MPWIFEKFDTTFIIKEFSKHINFHSATKLYMTSSLPSYKNLYNHILQNIFTHFSNFVEKEYHISRSLAIKISSIPVPACSVTSYTLFLIDNLHFLEEKNMNIYSNKSRSILKTMYKNSSQIVKNFYNQKEQIAFQELELCKNKYSNLFIISKNKLQNDIKKIWKMIDLSNIEDKLLNEFKFPETYKIAEKTFFDELNEYLNTLKKSLYVTSYFSKHN